MGWNDHLDPAEYDPSDPDSMMRAAIKVARMHPSPNPPARHLRPVGECWECGRNDELFGAGKRCAICACAKYM